MATSSDALFSCLLEDLSPYLSSAEFCALLCEEKVPLVAERGLKRNAATQLANAFYAKYVGNAPGETGEQRAWEKFLLMNSRCENYRPESACSSTWEDELYGEFKSLLYHLFYPSPNSTFEYYHVLSEARNGPGASIGSTGCDSYTKLFASKGACTSEFLFKYFSYFADSDPRWSDALNLRLTTFGDPSVVEGSKLSFVPKNREVYRSICTEPSLNMFYQLGLGSIFEQRLKAFTGIDLSVQPDRNRELSRLGSIDGSFATIDLSSASDTISLNLLRDCLPKELFQMLVKLRSPVTSYKGVRVPLHMVSTMGNGFTFPLQTIVFTCALLAVYRVFGISVAHPFGCLGNYGVFGDDIICVRDAYRPLCGFLGRLGFIVNESKSFNEGPFRESCGVDFLSGVNIRGVYVKTLDTPQALTVLVNRLNEWTARTGIPLRSTCHFLVKRCRFNPVPLYENDDSGVRVPLSLVEVRKYDKHVQSIRYERWVARPSFLTIDGSNLVVRAPRHERRRFFNPEGLYLEFLHSGLRDFRISIRHDAVRYSRRRSISPNWDYMPPVLGIKSSVQVHVLPFPKAVLTNLG